MSQFIRNWHVIVSLLCLVCVPMPCPHFFGYEQVLDVVGNGEFICYSNFFFFVQNDLEIIKHLYMVVLLEKPQLDAHTLKTPSLMHRDNQLIVRKFVGCELTKQRVNASYFLFFSFFILSLSFFFPFSQLCNIEVLLEPFINISIKSLRALLIIICSTNWLISNVLRLLSQQE